MSSPVAETSTAERSRGRDFGRVLVVTDGRTAKPYTSSLSQTGFTVVEAAGGTAALVALRRSRPHVVIVDTSLKGLSAEELSRMLVKARDGMPFVLVGEVESTTARRGEAMAAGAFDYFQIPSELPLLLARTTQLVALKQGIEGLRAEADRDYLTGLANRRRFRNALGQEVERWRRYSIPCALLLADIDHLKKINDTHGHTAGDVVIRHVASALTKLSRDNDTAARLGGEEFALLLAGADAMRAISAAERLRQAVSATPILGIGTVTISLGVASCPVHADSERSIYHASDAALYRAKGEGRNRTVVASATSPSDPH